MKHSVVELPFNQFIGLEPAIGDGRLLSLPAAARYLNHLETVHASALLALAEASSGEFLLRRFGSSAGVIPVVRRLEAKFRKPAHGRVSSTASVSAEGLAALDADLAEKGRVLVTVNVEVYDEAGTHALSASVEWFIQKAAA